MEITVTISSDYGYVILVVCSTWFLLNWLESRTFQARRKYEVPVSDNPIFIPVILSEINIMS